MLFPAAAASLLLLFKNTDIPTFLLANYKSVAEVKEKFTPAKYSLVSNPAVYSALYKLSAVTATRVSHYPIHDVHGESAVLEFSLNEQEEFTFTVKDNTAAIVTNSPLLETQQEYAEAFQQSQTDLYGINGLVMTPGGCGFYLTSSIESNRLCVLVGVRGASVGIGYTAGVDVVCQARTQY